MKFTRCTFTEISSEKGNSFEKSLILSFRLTIICFLWKQIRCVVRASLLSIQWDALKAEWRGGPDFINADQSVHCAFHCPRVPRQNGHKA